MSASYVIKLDADESDLDQAVDRSLDKIERLADKASGIDIGGAGAARGSGTGRGGLVSDPWARHEAATANLSGTKMTGLTGDALRPYELSAARSARGVEAADRLLSGQTGSTGRLISRMTASGGFSLGLRISEMLGEGAMIGAGAAYGAYQMLGAAGASARDLGSAYHIGGGSVSDTASISSIGRFMGRTASESAGAAVNFGAALHEASYGAGYFRNRGIVDLGGLTTNKDTNYISAVRQLADEPNRATATRVARDTGLTDELWMRDLSKADREAVMGGMNDQLGPSERRAEANIRQLGAKGMSFLERSYRDVRNWFTKANLDPDDIYRRNMAVMYGMNPDKAEWDDIMTYERSHGIEATQMEREQGHDWKKQPNSGQAGSVSVRTKSGIVGGGQRVQSSMPAAVKMSQLDQNLEGYGRYAGGYPG